MARAYIYGIGTASGAYLARLLLARGYEVAGSGAPDGAWRLTSLGIADQLVDTRPAVADEIYVIEPTGFELQATAQARLCLVGDVAAAEAARSAGRFATSAQLFDNDSRLSDAASPAMQIIAQVHAARTSGAAIVLNAPAKLRDWGWTPEYVDAMWRILQQPEPRDYVVATGTTLSEAAFARHACEYFSVDIALAPADFSVPAGSLADATPAAADLGWRAYTHGRDLVRTLCEGYAAEQS
jgi:GDPmannose 4,6-dehydratase